MLRTLFCILIAGVWTLVMFCACMLSMLFTLRVSASMFWVQRVWSPVLTWAPGGRVEVQGREHVDPKRPTIYVSNHQSTLDIPVLFQALPVDLRFIAKSQLKYVPLIGWYMRLANFVFVDRSNHGRALASLRHAGEQIRKGVSVAVFAEGTRSEGRILPFKKGSFALAASAGVPICPVAIEGSGALMPKNRWTFTPGPIRVKIGAPIDPARFAGDRDALLVHVRNELITLHEEIGGQGGDRADAVAARGMEGIGKARDAG